MTPLVRKLASEHGIDLASVAGTGVGGRIRKQDVLDAASARRGQAAGPGQPAAGRRAAGRRTAGPRAAVQHHAGTGRRAAGTGCSGGRPAASAER